MNQVTNRNADGSFITLVDSGMSYRIPCQCPLFLGGPLPDSDILLLSLDSASHNRSPRVGFQTKRLGR